MENILKELGFEDVRSLSKLASTEIVTLQESVQTILADSCFIDKLNDDEKKSLFGTKFWFRPEKFMFLPGEKVQIELIGELCMKIVDGMKISAPSFPQFSSVNTNQHAQKLKHSGYIKITAFAVPC